MRGLGRTSMQPAASRPFSRGDRGRRGLELFLGELATLRNLGLAIPILVFADAQLDLNELKQRTSQPPNLALDFRAVDFPPSQGRSAARIPAVRNRAALAWELEAATASRSSLPISAGRLLTGGFDGRRIRRNSTITALR